MNACACGCGGRPAKYGALYIRGHRPAPTAAEISARFWAKVNKNGPAPAHVEGLGECWVWTAATRSSGYGCFGVGTLVVPAHRFAYEETNGPIDAGLFICHRCDNKLCVRPSHLFAATHIENMADMRAKGRGNGPKGDRNANCRFTAEQIESIRRRFEDGETAAAIAADVGCTSQYVGQLARGVWRKAA